MSYKLFSEINWENEASAEFAQYWRSLAAPGSLPKQSDFNPAAITHLLPGVAIYELRDENKIVCRLMGTGLVEYFGHDYTDGNILKWWSREEREGAKTILRDMVEKPCGIFAHISGLTESDAKVSGVSVGFPALDRDGHANRLIFHTNSVEETRSRIAREDKVIGFEVESSSLIDLS